LLRKPEKKRPLQRPRYEWEDNISMDFRVTGCENVDWMHLAQDRDLWWALINIIMNLWVP
jgi:hypothetical protein